MQPGYLLLGCFGKSMAAKENYVSVDKNQVDAHGIPIPVVHFQFVENDYAALAGDAQRACSRLPPSCPREVFLDREHGSRRDLPATRWGPSAWGKTPRLPR